MLKYKLNKEDFDKLDDTLKGFYAPDGDNFVLQAEGATDKSKLDEFRSTNVDLMKKIKEVEGIDLDKYNSMLETERKLRDRELIEKGDIDTLIAERTNAIQSDFSAKIEAMNSQLSESQSKYNKLQIKHEIEGAALKAFGAAKIRPDAHDAVMAQIKTKFTIDNGQVVAKDGDKILTGADGNLTISEFVSSQPDFMKVPNQAGGGEGDAGQAPQMNGKSSVNKIASGLAGMMNK